MECVAMIAASVGVIFARLALMQDLNPFLRGSHAIIAYAGAPGYVIFPWRSPVGAPIRRSSGLGNRFWQRSFRQRTNATPLIEFTVASRGFQRGQGQHPVRRPTHPLVFATCRHRPVVVSLHPCARNPSPRLLPSLGVRDVRPPLLQVRDQLLDRRGVPDPLQCPSQKSDRGLHLPFPQLSQEFLLEPAASILGAPAELICSSQRFRRCHRHKIIALEEIPKPSNHARIHAAPSPRTRDPRSPLRTPNSSSAETCNHRPSAVAPTNADRNPATSTTAVYVQTSSRPVDGWALVLTSSGSTITNPSATARGSSRAVGNAGSHPGKPVAIHSAWACPHSAWAPSESSNGGSSSTNAVLASGSAAAGPSKAN